MRGVKAALIAGGMGTRIRGVAGEDIPKALVPLAGEAVVVRQLRLLARHGILEVAVMAGHLARVLRAGMEPEARRLGMTSRFFVEEEPLGTAGGLWAARRYLGDGDFIVLYADLAVEMDLERLLSFHRSSGAAVTVTAHPNDHPHESDLIRAGEDGRVTEVLPRTSRPPGDYPNLVPAAVYGCSPSLFTFLEAETRQDFIGDVFPKMAAEGALYAYRTPEYLRDMGTAERFAMAERDITAGLPERMHWSQSRPAVFFDRDGVLNEEVGGQGLIRLEQFQLLPGAAEAVRLVNERGWLAVVATNQPQVAKGFITSEALQAIHDRLETRLGLQGAKLDRIHFCPHHPDGGFEGEISELKVACDCRKPSPGMILKASAELPIHMEESCFIGDTWRDAGAARAAGIFAYGVRTGMGCRGWEGPHRPDLIFENVLEAVRFILQSQPQADWWAAEINRRLSARETPFVMGVCGLARAGKSTFSHALTRSLGKLGVKVLHVRLDDWILPLSRRVPGMSSQERCRVHLYPSILSALKAGGPVTVQPYDAASRGTCGEITYHWSGEKVILLDGVHASHAGLRPGLDLALMVEAVEADLDRRFLSFYRWKGEPDESASQLLLERKEVEWPEVLSQRTMVDEVVRLEATGRTR